MFLKFSVFQLGLCGVLVLIEKKKLCCSIALFFQVREGANKMGSSLIAFSMHTKP